MNKTKISGLMIVFSLVGGRCTVAQECRSLPSTTSDALVSYLTDIVPSDDNADCITFAIKELDQRRYEPAIPALVRLLDFRRPPNSHEKNHIILRPRSTAEMYPAVAALEEMGKRSLPPLLEVIKSATPAIKARENAVTVWMEIYKNEAPEGVASLKHQMNGTDDENVKGNLNWALAKAQTLCSSRDRIRCRAAAGGPTAP